MEEIWKRHYTRAVQKAQDAVVDAIRIGDWALVQQRTKALEYLLRYHRRS
jgi:hypothetical protein